MELKDRKIAVFIAELYEDLEFWYPLLRMREAGAEVESIGPKAAEYRGKHGLAGRADIGIEKASPDDYDALIIPGGYAPDHMRRSAKMVDFVRGINKGESIIAAICHGPWMLASAEIIEGKEVTSFFSIRDDLIHAGANWVDREVARDGNIITSRMPGDLPAFCRAVIDAVANS